MTPQLNDRDFARFQKLILDETGIYLAPVKKALLVGRLGSRLRHLGLTKFRDYFEVVIGDEAELVEMLDRVCTNETHFFRDPRQFTFLRKVVIPEWQRQAALGLRNRSIRIWSAACSSGEEPYSLAMLLKNELDSCRPAWQIDILATDLSTRVLAKAREGVWPAEKVTEIPDALLKKYMLKGVRAQAGKIKVGPEIREIVHFDRLNLIDEAPPVRSDFDAIFCRNVLIYFNAETKKDVLTRLLSRVAPAGYLFLGQAETMNAISDRAKMAGPGAYQPLEPRRTGA
ncbi:MAG: protein-glutamate O-methyltransferase CheR [Acidobacteriota bacterium]